jgi:phosphoribosylformimino-5-aminoimidazole carboxamide ribotide isomerase
MLTPPVTPTIIPVIDLLGGQVVHAVAGARDRYQPIRSSLCDSSHPLDVANALRAHLQTNELYVADLDGICGNEPAKSIVEELVANGFQLWLDAGPSLCGESYPAVTMVLATEWTAQDLPADKLESWQQPWALGIDLENGRVKSRHAGWDRQLPLAVVDQVSPESIIVLDISGVGTERGPAASVLHACEQLKTARPNVKLISGGGVRNRTDVSTFHDAGCDAVLVATAAHRAQL